jgi:hypothetical protein
MFRFFKKSHYKKNSIFEKQKNQRKEAAKKRLTGPAQHLAWDVWHVVRANQIGISALPTPTVPRKWTGAGL